MNRRTFVAAGLVALPGLAAAPAAHATFPGANGQLVIERVVHRQADLFLMQPDGSAVRRLTTTKTWEEKPEWSADGQRLVFSRSTPSGFPSEIATLDLTGGGVRALTRFGSASAAPTFAPDGRVAFFSLKDFPPPSNDGPPPPAELYSIAGDGTAVRQLTKDKSIQTDPEWSPDGSTIMYSQWRAVRREPGLYDIGLSAMDAEGSHKRAILPPSAKRDIVTQSWSPDGTQIILEIATARPNGRPGHGARQSDLAVVNANGTGFRRLTRTAALEAMPVWSPDGTRIAFASDRHVRTKKGLDRSGPDFEIYTMAADGTDIRRITRNHVPDLYPDWQPLLP